MSVVEAADVEQIGDLFQHLHGVGNATGPEGVPDGIDLRAEFAGELMTSFRLSQVLCQKAQHAIFGCSGVS